MSGIVKCLGEAHGTNFAAYHGDCVDVVRQLPDASMDLSVFSPPFSGLYIYNDSEADFGNCKDDEEFLEHFDFLAGELLRVTRPGRLAVLHCKDLVYYKTQRDTAGLRDFPGMLVSRMTKAGFDFHSRVTIWRCPVREMTKTKAHGLLYKQLRADSSFSRQGLPEYFVVFRRWAKTEEEQALVVPVTHTKDEFPLDQWQEWASPVWMSTRETDVLQARGARGPADEKHICLARGSLVLTRERGYVPIQTVTPGEHALTHKGRWRPVLAVQKTGTRAAVTMRAHGVPGLTLTPDHKVWARKSRWVRQREGAERAEPGWLEAQSTFGGYVNLKLPETQPHGVTDPLTWWIVGRWIADGHWERRGAAILSCGKHETEGLLSKLGARAGGVYDTGTAIQIRLLDRSGQLKRILRECGEGAGEKRMPPCAATLPKEQASALLAGYLSGDGYFIESRQRWQASSISRVLLLGVAALVQRVHGAIATVFAGRPARASHIQGREVQCHQEWVLSFNARRERRQEEFILDDGAWKKVRSIEPAGEVETWNLRVEEDESYTAEGMIVKNCAMPLDLTSRAVALWSNPGDTVLSPFMGVGSEGVASLRRKRRFVGVELKESYFRQAVKYLQDEDAQGGLFDADSKRGTEAAA